MVNSHSDMDIIVQEGDVLKVPKQLQTVRLSGAVLYPVTVRFDHSYRFRSYISRAGGFATEAQKGKSYVIYANGSIDQTRKIFFFNRFPRIEPGAEIIVPKKTERKGMSTGEVVGISSALASFSLIVITIINTIKW
jgi:protein involved in polysaccharide export with SLBB domain